MARDYGNAIENATQTGFPSACAEFAEKSLSLDEFFVMGGPHKRLFRITIDYPLFKIQKGDLLHIDTSRPVKNGMLVLVSYNGEIGVFKKYHGGLLPLELREDQMVEATVYAITGLSRAIVHDLFFIEIKLE